MSEIFLTIVFGLAAAGIGWPIAGFLGCARLHLGERFLFAFALGMTAVALATYTVAWIRLDKVSMGFVFFAAIAVAIPGLRAMPWPTWAASIRATFFHLGSHPGEALLWLALVTVGLSGFLQGLSPPNDYDSLHYHLALAKYDIELGRLGVAWDKMPYPFYPILMGSLTRLVWVLTSAETAQLTHGLFAFAAAGGAGALAIRLSGTKTAATLAALLVLSSRVVVWEMATAQVDVVLAMYSMLALLAFLSWAREPQIGLSILFGVMLGGAVATKYLGIGIGLAFTPLVLMPIIRIQGAWKMAIVVALAAAAVYAPFGIRNAILTGNPFFPILNSIFLPRANVDIESFRYSHGIGYDLRHLVTVLWDISVHPLRFDGMMLGAPYLVALAPLAAAAWQRNRPFGPSVVFILSYVVIWFWLLSQQARFLSPVIPALAALAAVGIASTWNLVRFSGFTAAILSGALTIFALNQSIFIAAYVTTRLPPALNVISAESYHRNTPSMNGAHYSACKWLSERLQPEETALIWLSPSSSYCPQRQGFLLFPAEWGQLVMPESLPQLTTLEFVRLFEQHRVRYVAIHTHTDLPGKRGEGLAPLFDEYKKTRYGRHISSTLQSLKPVYIDARVSIYDGHEILPLLRRHEKLNP